MTRKRDIVIISKKSFLLNKPNPGLPWILRVAAEHWHKDYDFDRYGGVSCFLSYIQEGKLLFKSEFDQFEAGPGEVIYLANEDIYWRIKVLSEQGAQLLIMVLRGRVAFDQTFRILGKKTNIFSLSDPACVESLFYSMFNTAEKGYPTSANIAANLLLPILQVINQENKKFDKKSDPNLAMYNLCREYINHNYHEIFSVSDVAAKFSITHNRLCRLFKSYEKCTPHNFLLQRKMTHALYELQQNEMTLAEIAYELGFSDPYSFSKTFKRIMGYNPSEARNKSNSY